ncbi:unnamed protein product [Heligmosomoides polygyrus]|uniref:Uncharacterized protein n=1 Tax=Heligmosomoides polygyrus TaxID=6339 RepID=A0A183GJ85_HELPZ|nr:unnamed protein product [Heligmosomoides polygyrus]
MAAVRPRRCFPLRTQDGSGTRREAARSAYRPRKTFYYSHLYYSFCILFVFVMNCYNYPVYCEDGGGGGPGFLPCSQGGDGWRGEPGDGEERESSLESLPLRVNTTNTQGQG